MSGQLFQRKKAFVVISTFFVFLLNFQIKQSIRCHVKNGDKKHTYTFIHAETCPRHFHSRYIYNV